MSTDLKLVTRAGYYGTPYGRVDLQVDGADRFTVSCQRCGSPDWRTEPCKHEIALYASISAAAAEVKP